MHNGKVVLTSKCERVTVTSPEGKTYDLGSPDSWLFPLRVWLYKKKRGI